ncbi:hypothetical protein [Streptomyces sp. NPDC048639]|uniref:hypothetical protein n=1 Tax=Streptomyces sp. NPDC048639 TaxID=3365581 RepID=UPI003716BC4E
MIPSVRAMDEITRLHTRLRLAHRNAFGPHTAQTPRLRRERCTERGGRVDGLGFDATFRRMWNLHLAHSQAGFAAGHLDVERILFTGGDAEDAGCAAAATTGEGDAR